MEYGQIQNTAIRDDVSRYARRLDLMQKNTLTIFQGQNKRQTAKLPYGSQVFNNNKIRIETQELQTQLSVSKRSTKKVVIDLR